MFTGIVEEMGTVRAIAPNGTGARLEFQASRVLADAQLGASIAVNGCCLTVVTLGDGWWAADAIEETLRRTSLGALAPSDRVNLERPVRLTDRLGGHLVQGHVDGVGVIASCQALGDGSRLLRVEAPAPLLPYVVEKGSIAVDGVSLTVISADERGFTVGVIPHTQSVTTLGFRAPGDPVNLEADLVAKYVERLLQFTGNSGTVGTVAGTGR